MELFSVVILTALSHLHHHPWNIATSNTFLLSYSFPLLLKWCIESYVLLLRWHLSNRIHAAGAFLMHVVGAVDVCVS